MASKLEYEVPPAPMPGPREEWAAVLEVLHRSGTLRVLRGFFGRLGPVSDVALEEINSEAGRNLLGGILAVGQVLTRIDAGQEAKVAEGLSGGVPQSKYVNKPPGFFKLLRLLTSADTRRALGVMLQLLREVGVALRHPVPHQPKK